MIDWLIFWIEGNNCQQSNDVVVHNVQGVATSSITCNSFGTFHLFNDIETLLIYVRQFHYNFNYLSIFRQIYRKNINRYRSLNLFRICKLVFVLNQIIFMLIFIPKSRKFNVLSKIIKLQNGLMCIYQKVREILKNSTQNWKNF